ncbi:hypothetical protein AB0K34_04870 [Actinomadura sp. NPDC049382]|uniref:hypothetical protein n=1 Tax=Actinomadura sp. NPDC049382 TaxID=3158220 RepID=UPI00342D8720
MPLLTGTRTGPGTGIPLPGVGFATASFTDPSGTVWPLTDEASGWFTLSDGVSGLDVTPYELTKDSYPRGGSRLRHRQPAERTIIWPLHVYGDTHLQFLGRWRDLGTAFAATLHDGPGWLEIARPDGTRRRIQVIYQDGFEGRAQQGTGIISDTAILALYCQDPYWLDPVPVTEHRSYGLGVDFLNPFPSVSSGRVLGETTLLNTGSVEAWPTWTITGPATLVTITNQDTGEAFVLDPDADGIGHGPLLAGEQVVVTTDPPRVRGPLGETWTGALNWPGAVLWSLRRGVNRVNFQLDGAAEGSAVDVSFNARYEMA